MDDSLLIGLQSFQDLLRLELHQNAQAEAQTQRKRADVTARWLGFDSQGRGTAEYEGKVYTCEVIGSKSKPKYAPINLRRTKAGNYCDWQ